MTKKARVRAVINGEKPDRIPSGFWYHFPPSRHAGAAAVEAHVDFLERTDVDILKIMNEHLYRVEQPPDCARGWRSIASLPLSSQPFTDQLEIVRRVLDEVGDSVYTLITVHGVFASAFHALSLPEERFARANPLEYHLKEDPEAVAEGLHTIAGSLLAFAHACIELGVDGVYYAALGGERYRSYSRSAFERAIKAGDVYVLRELAREDIDLFVHICKADLDFAPYADYPGDIFNWATHSNGLSIRAGYELFRRPVLGGFDDRSGVLVDGTNEEIGRAAVELVRGHSDIPFILGADCTLPTELGCQRIRSAVEAARVSPADNGG